MLNLLRRERRRPKVARLTALCSFDQMEERLLMTATPTGRPTLSYSAEVTTAYGQNSYMPVQAATHGSGSYGFLQWGFLEFGNSSAVFDPNTGVAGVNNVSLQLYNTATSGNYRPYAGSFSVYVIPNDAVPSANVRFQSGQTGVNSAGSTSGGPSSLGITGNPSDWLVGTWSITSGLQSGYSTFVGSTTGSTATGTGASGSGAVLGSQAALAIKNDLNNDTPIRFAVVANDTGFAADWEGNFSSNYPLLSFDITQAPQVGLSSPTYSVNETDQNPANNTDLTVIITRTSNPSVTTTVHWAASNVDVPVGGFDAQSGNVTFAPGETSKPVTIHFHNITTTQNQGRINIALSDPGQTGGNPAPVFSTSQTTAVGTINYIQAATVNLSTSLLSVNEADGTATIQVSRTGAPAALNTIDTTVSYTTADGTPYLNDPTAEENALAGRDYETSSGTLHWAPGDTSTKTIVVTLDNVKTFAGTRWFSLSLSNPSSGTALGVSQATVTITDNAVAGSTTTSGLPNYTVPVEVSGPYLPYTNSFMAFVSQPHGSYGYASMPLLEFESATPGVYPTPNSVGSVESIRLSIYNTATTGGYAGTPGSFDVYVLNDDSVPDTNIRYGGGTGATGPGVIAGQADPIYVGTAFFPNNVVGYNEFTFDNLSAAAKASLTADLNAGTKFRLVITPSAGSPVAADWEGNWVQNQPMLDMLLTPPVATLPAWLAPGSAATWDAGTHTLNVTGAATIIADPGADSPKIVASGASAQLAISPNTVGFVHIGGVTLSGGAGITVPAVSGRTNTNHNVVVIDSTGGAPTFSIDASSDFNLASNDLIVRNGNLAGIQAAANTGRDLPPGGSGIGGDWAGHGLTSSTAATAYNANGYEYSTLGVARNGDLLFGSYATWQAGSSTLTLNANDVIVKYTYNGDFTLDGKVNDDDATLVAVFYDGGATTTHSFIEGDANGDGKVDDDDATLFSLTYLLGTNGDQL